MVADKSYKDILNGKEVVEKNNGDNFTIAFISSLIGLAMLIFGVVMRGVGGVFVSVIGVALLIVGIMGWICFFTEKYYLLTKEIWVEIDHFDADRTVFVKNTKDEMVLVDQNIIWRGVGEKNQLCFEGNVMNPRIFIVVAKDQAQKSQ